MKVTTVEAMELPPALEAVIPKAKANETSVIVPESFPVIGSKVKPGGTVK